MKFLRTRHKLILAACTMTLCTAIWNPLSSHAATHDVTLKNGDQLTYPVYTRDTGTITPDLSTITIPDTVLNPTTPSEDSDNPLTPSTGSDTLIDNPDSSATGSTSSTGTDLSSDKPGNTSAKPETPEEDPKKKEEAIQEYLNSLHFVYSDSTDSSVLSFDSQTHQFQALNPGTVTISVYAYESQDHWNQNPVFTATIAFTVSVDMTNVTLTQNALTAYLSPMYYYGKKKPYYSNSTSEFQIGVNSSYVFNPDASAPSHDSYYDSYDYNASSDPYLTYTCTQSDKIQFDITLANNVLYIEARSSMSKPKAVTSVLTLNLCGKVFTIPVTLQPLTISDQSLLLVKGKKKTLKVTGAAEAIQWTSTNPKIAAVDSKGTIKGKKIGNCVIIGKIGNAYVGCAVSVTTAQLKKVATFASYMGTHWKYSQAKRTQTGYYDCSALVWKAYKRYTRLNFGSAGYPGVALSEAKWCNSHHKMLKGGFRYKKVLKMQYNPGDLVFKSTNMKKKYADIYHVEMITGYHCYGVASDGTPYIDMTWGARGTGYGAEEGSLLGRPMK